MTNPRTINLSKEEMAALARRKITDMPTPISPLVSKICRKMMMDTAKKTGIAPTIRYRAMLYSSHSLLAHLERDPVLLIKQAATQAVRGYLNGTR